MLKKTILLMLLLLVFSAGTLLGDWIPEKTRNIPEPFPSGFPNVRAINNSAAIEPDIELEFIGSCLWSQARDIWADDSYLFVLFHNTLVIYYMYFYAEPEYFHHVYFPGAAESFYRSGDYFYICAGRDGLFIIDVAMTTEDPHPVGYYNTPGFAQEVVVSGTNAFVADGDGGLQIISISNPEYPTFLGSYTQLDYIENVAVNGALVYVGDTLGNMHILAIPDPSLPLKLGEYNSPCRFRDMEVVDTIVYLGSEFSDGLQIVNVGQPDNPALLSNYGVTGMIVDLFVKDSLVYFPDGDGYFQIININDPLNPAFTGKILQCGGIFGSGMKLYVHHITLFSTSIALEGCSGICVMDVDDPALPAYVGDFGYCWMPGDVEVVDDLLYSANFWGGLEIFNISDPTFPVHLGSSHTAGYACGIQVCDTLAFVAAGFRGLEIHDISNPSAPVYLWNHFSDSVAWSYDLLVHGNRLYLPAGYGKYGGLCILEISDLENPTLLSRSGDGASQVTIKNNLAYYTDFHDGLRIIDISSPTLPTWVGDYLLPGYTYQVVLKDTLAFVTNDSGLYIADISEPADITTLYLYRTTGQAEGIAVRGNLAYVTDAIYGLQVLDISDPTNPQLLGGYDTPGKGSKLTLKDSLIFLADMYSIIILNDPFYVPCCQGLTGNVDCSEDEEPDISDITRLIDYLYLSHFSLCCPEEADVNGSGGEPDISDITAIISYLYIAHEPLAACP